MREDCHAAPSAGDGQAKRSFADQTLTFAPNSYDAEAGEVDVVWSTGAAVRRVDWGSGEAYEEELDLAGADLTRLAVGAPLLLDHARSVNAVVGSVVPGSPRVASGVGIARVRFDRSSPEGQMAEAKVSGGHLRHVSIGYRVETWNKVEATGRLPRWIARTWEPFEISLVAVPAEVGAGVRSAFSEISQATAGAPAVAELSMPTQMAPNGPPITGHDAVRAERERVSAIMQRVQALGLPMSLAERCIEDGSSAEVASARMVDALAARHAQTPAPNNVSFRGTGGSDSYDSPVVMRNAMSEALAARMLDREPAGNAQRFRGWSVPEMVRETLERDGIRTQGWSPTRVMDTALSRGMHTTSDFPVILSGAANRVLADLYKRAQSPIRQNLCRVRHAPDFRQLRTVRVSDFSELKKVGEAGEVEAGTLDEQGESYRVETYSRRLILSRQALVNDDLGAFQQATQSAAVAAAEVEAKTLVALLTAAAGAGPNLADGQPLFTTTRGTLAASAATISSAAVSLGRATMRKQPALGATGPTGVGPKYLLVGADKETDAQQLVAQIAPATVSDVNPFVGNLVPLVDARLAGNAWWLFADPAEAAVLEVAYLEGRSGPTVETFGEAERLGETIRVTHDFGAGVIGWRGTWRNPGV